MFLAIILFLLPTAMADEPACREIRLAQDDAHVIERRGWTLGQQNPGNEFANPFGDSPIIPRNGSRAPDVRAVDARNGFRTKPVIPLTVDAARGSGCVDFGDIRAFNYAYEEADLPKPRLIVTVNGSRALNEEGSSLFSARATNFRVMGLRSGDRIEILVVLENEYLNAGCAEIPTMETTAPCAENFRVRLWERRAYVY